MFVVGGLYARTGIASFDPVSDGRLMVGIKGIMEAIYFTFRKEGEPLPKGGRQVGAFLSDYNSHVLYVPARNGTSFPYVEEIVIPRLVNKQGYEHSPYAGVFAPPIGVGDLTKKLAMLNELYFPASGATSSPKLKYGDSFDWRLDPERGVVEVTCVAEMPHPLLRRYFYWIVVQIKPDRWLYNPLLEGAKLGVAR